MSTAMGLSPSPARPSTFHQQGLSSLDSQTSLSPSREPGNPNILCYSPYSHPPHHFIFWMLWNWFQYLFITVHVSYQKSQTPKSFPNYHSHKTPNIPKSAPVFQPSPTLETFPLCPLELRIPLPHHFSLLPPLVQATIISCRFSATLDFPLDVTFAVKSTLITIFNIST